MVLSPDLLINFENNEALLDKILILVKLVFNIVIRYIIQILVNTYKTDWFLKSAKLTFFGTFSNHEKRVVYCR